MKRLWIAILLGAGAVWGARALWDVGYRQGFCDGMSNPEFMRRLNEEFSDDVSP